jgi:phosphotriesterase-related protein
MAQTVLGPVRPEALGLTSSHEHLLLDFTLAFKNPPQAGERHRAFQPVTIDNLGWVRYDPFKNHPNLLTLDEEVSISEALLFRQEGGGTMIDTTSAVGIRRDPLALARISRATGLNIVMGSGYYVAATHPEGMDAKTEGQIVREIVADITTGAGTTGVKSGIIGELGCSWPLMANERKGLRAGARAQQETGASITVHPGRSDAAPFEVLDILADAGADTGRVIIDHLDRTISDVDTLLRLAERGCYLEYDFFGWEISQFSLSESDMLNDAQRIGFIKRLVDEGYSRKVVIGHDMFGRHRLTKYGGHGFAHILRNIAPRMREAGLTADQVDDILVKNPAAILTFR